MKTQFTILFLALFSFMVNSQTITAKPIYKGSQSLSIKEFDTGAIAFLYQDNNLR